MAALALGADVAGKWTGQMPARGETVDATFTFRNEGGKVTGTMTGPQGQVDLQDVKVEGDQISFNSTGGNAKSFSRAPSVAMRSKCHVCAKAVRLASSR
jgi:hypothetical protein